MNAAIEALLRPRSIAILGASADFQKLNGRALKARPKELDLNPVLCRASEVVGVDWPMVLDD